MRRDEGINDAGDRNPWETEQSLQATTHCCCGSVAGVVDVNSHGALLVLKLCEGIFQAQVGSLTMQQAEEYTFVNLMNETGVRSSIGLGPYHVIRLKLEQQ